MAHFLVKSEPVKYPWSQLVKDKHTHWDGVRNHQAAINLKAMKVGDQGFFYHSNEGLEIVGICEVAKTAYPDPSDATGRFVMVDLKPVKPLKHPVTLAAIKAEPRLKDFGLVRQGRLSVVTVSDAQWALILKMSEAAPK
jgi:predicted RNA-binding protein with PUA-like domain